MSIGSKPLHNIEFAGADGVTGAVTELLTAANNTEGIRAVDCFNDTDQPLELVMGVSGSEVNYLFINKGAGIAGPIHIPQGVRLGVRVLDDGTTSSGHFTMNLYV